MARVPYLQQSDLPPEHQDILARPIALNRAMANSPSAAKAMTGLAMYIRHHSKLDPRLRELAILQVGYLARSPYEYSHHVKLGREAGVTDDDIRAINEETAGRPTKLDALSKTILRAARDRRASLEEIQQEVQAQVPQHRSLIDLLVPKSAADLYTLIARFF